jgi:uncharacterized protein (DUF2141 family)
MRMKKREMLIGLCLLMFAAPVFSQTKTITVEIHQVTVNGGTVYVSASSSKEAYKKQQPDKTASCEPDGSVVRVEMTVPTGDCIINTYQDRNGNGKCDNNLLGIPKEPVGITNWDGKGVPGSFDKLKIAVTPDTQTVRIHLHQL